MKNKRRTSIFLLVLLLFQTLTNGILPTISAAEEISLSEDLILHYDMVSAEEQNGEIIIHDVSGNSEALDGVFRNPENGNLKKNSDIGYVSFTEEDDDFDSGYIEIPKYKDGSDLLAGLEDVTVST